MYDVLYVEVFAQYSLRLDNVKAKPVHCQKGFEEFVQEVCEM